VISRAAIQSLMKAGLITVTPEPTKMGPNSIDLRLGDTLKTYHPTKNRITVVDPVSGAEFRALNPKNPPPLVDVPKLRYGRWLLVPGQFYLGVTLEETYCRGVVPHLDGRSTCGRLSIEAHKTAGVGDNGFRGRWTLEIEVTEPVLVAPGDRLFQVYFTPCWGEGLALLIRSLADGTPAWLNAQDPLWVQAGRMLQDGGPEETGALLELRDLYGQGEGHHYQGSGEVRGPSPLD
jgi:dCTP deaminase